MIFYSTPMLRIGLTGGIGSGKSTVADLFAARGVPVIDTDALARTVVEPGKPALTEIVARFGTDVIDDQGQLNRMQMREHVFADPQERKALEAILHPRIRAEVQHRLATLNAAYALIVIPLLFESNQTDLVDRILVVDAPVDAQRSRVAARDHASSDQIDAILAAQLPRSERLARADDVIDNSGDLAALDNQIETLHRRYCELATQHR